jgi:ADP-ribosylglycohydrolase
MTRYQKILGCLVGAAAGDALGAATEMRTYDQIRSFFNGPVRDFIASPNDTFARGRMPGQITDDFSIAYASVLTLLAHQGEVNEQSAKEALLNWSKSPEFEQFAGPTTRIAIYQLLGQKVENRLDFLVNDNGKSSNGAAMKSAPLALFAKADVDQAIHNAYVMSMPSHDNQLSISAAAAIAAATAEAMKNDSSLSSVIQAGLYGARQGEALGIRHGKTLAGPSVTRRIEWALQLTQEKRPVDEIMRDLSDLIGTGLPANEAIPTVFGIINALGHQPMEAIFEAVNIGNDTDTIATMVGGILGALYGIDIFPSHYLDVLNRTNNYRLDQMAKDIEDCVYGQ